MKKTVDARGMQCPLPVIETKKTLKEVTEGTIEVLVDNEIAVQNLSKMANQMKLSHGFEKISNDHYIVTIEKEEASVGEITTKEKSEESLKPKEFATKHEALEAREDATVIVISADHMGEGEEQLGKTLMKGFIYALTELDRLPKQMIFYNKGATLTVEGSDSLEDLKLLEAEGVEILTCGACLNFYGITDKLSVGSVTNMYAIAEIMMNATKIIKP